jgi:hypothetical protein
VSPAAPLLDHLTNEVRISAASPELETANNEAEVTIVAGRLFYLPLVMREG